MKFQLMPVLSLMEEIYRMPISQDRFQKYIRLLNGGNKDQLSIPIGGYNPMAKESVLKKLIEMKELGAEQIAKKALLEINNKLEKSDKVIKVGLNLVDDFGGSWSNKNQTSFESIFKFNGVFNYDFCTPYFWMSEEITAELIRRRTMEYVWRTVCWLRFGKPENLIGYLNQEIFVCKQMGMTENYHTPEIEKLSQFYQKHEESTDDSLILNFFYGDEASKQISYPTFGIGKKTGFDLAKSITTIE